MEMFLFQNLKIILCVVSLFYPVDIVKFTNITCLSSLLIAHINMSSLIWFIYAINILTQYYEHVTITGLVQETLIPVTKLK